MIFCCSRLRKRNQLKKDGNINQLRDANDSDDDENNTWNGNSTQQMQNENKFNLFKNNLLFKNLFYSQVD